MSRTKAYRRFVMQKVKKHVKQFVKDVWGDSELAQDVSFIGKLAHGKVCSCDMCCNTRRNQNLPIKNKLSKRELIALDELKHYENYI